MMSEDQAADRESNRDGVLALLTRADAFRAGDGESVPVDEFFAVIDRTRTTKDRSAR